MLDDVLKMKIWSGLNFFTNLIDPGAYYCTLTVTKKKKYIVYLCRHEMTKNQTLLDDEFENMTCKNIQSKTTMF